jgi:hypothetical protein
VVVTEPTTEPTSLTELVIRAKGSPLDDAEKRLVAIISTILVKRGKDCVGETIVAGLDEDDAAYVFTNEETFLDWMKETMPDLFKEVSPLGPAEVRIMILFPNEHVYCTNLVNRQGLN